jgi:hypothetical protein
MDIYTIKSITEINYGKSLVDKKVAIRGTIHGLQDKVEGSPFDYTAFLIDEAKERLLIRGKHKQESQIELTLMRMAMEYGANIWLYGSLVRTEPIFFKEMKQPTLLVDGVYYGRYSTREKWDVQREE